MISSRVLKKKAIVGNGSLNPISPFVTLVSILVDDGVHYTGSIAGGGNVLTKTKKICRNSFLPDFLILIRDTMYGRTPVLDELPISVIKSNRSRIVKKV